MDTAIRLSEDKRRRDEEYELRRHNLKAWESYVQKRGPRYAGKTLTNFKCAGEKQFNAVEKIKDWSEGLSDHIREGRSVILYGPVGTGKDHLITGLVRCLCERSILKPPRESVQWTSGRNLFRGARSIIGNKRYSEDEFIDEYAKPRLLVVSDLVRAGESISDWQSHVIYDILDQRYNHLRPTWLTINVPDRKALAEAIGPDVCDRLLDDALTVGCIWDSYRTQGNSTET